MKQPDYNDFINVPSNNANYALAILMGRLMSVDAKIKLQANGKSDGIDTNALRAIKTVSRGYKYYLNEFGRLAIVYRTKIERKKRNRVYLAIRSALIAEIGQTTDYVNKLDSRPTPLDLAVLIVARDCQESFNDALQCWIKQSRGTKLDYSKLGAQPIEPSDVNINDSSDNEDE